MLVTPYLLIEIIGVGASAVIGGEYRESGHPSFLSASRGRVVSCYCTWILCVTLFFN